MSSLPWESNSKGDSGSFNPPEPSGLNGSHDPSSKTGFVGDSVRQGGTQGEWNPPSAQGADVNGSGSGYSFPKGSVIGAGMPWETNSSDRK